MKKKGLHLGYKNINLDLFSTDDKILEKSELILKTIKEMQIEDIFFTLKEQKNMLNLHKNTTTISSKNEEKEQKEYEDKEKNKEKKKVVKKKKGKTFKKVVKKEKDKEKKDEEIEAIIIKEEDVDFNSLLKLTDCGVAKLSKKITKFNNINKKANFMPKFIVIKDAVKKYDLGKKRKIKKKYKMRGYYKMSKHLKMNKNNKSISINRKIRNKTNKKEKKKEKECDKI